MRNGIATQVKSNPKKFWKYAQSKTKTKVSIPNLYTNERKDSATSSDKEKAEVLADFFSSVFTVEVDSDLPSVKSRTNHKLESIEITPDKVDKK